MHDQAGSRPPGVPLAAAESGAPDAAAAAAAETGAAAEVVRSANMSHVANVRYPDAKRAANRKIDTQGGTDIEFATIKVARRIGGQTQMVKRDFSFAGTYQNGLQIVEISNPRQPRLVATYDCDLFQRRADLRA